MNIVPLGNRVLLERLKVDEQKTESGLVIPERGLPATYLNQVIAVGELVATVKEGDEVVTTVGSGDEIKVNQKSLFLVEQDDLLAVIDREGEVS